MQNGITTRFTGIATYRDGDNKLTVGDIIQLQKTGGIAGINESYDYVLTVADIKAIEEGFQEIFKFIKHDGPAVTFPLTAAQAEGLKNSNAVSPILVTDPLVIVKPDFLPTPTHPGDDGFWAEFEQVLDMQIDRHAGKSASTQMDLPKIFKGISIAGAAEAVHTDFPSKWPTKLAEYLLADGAKIDGDIIPLRSKDDFVNGPVLLAKTIGWAVSEVSPSAFAAKWNQGRARPESVAWAVQTGKLNAPKHIQDKIASLLGLIFCILFLNHVLKMFD